MRVQSGEAGLAQAPGGPCEVVAGRRGGPALRPAGGNSHPRSVAVVWQVARSGKRGPREVRHRGARKDFGLYVRGGRRCRGLLAEPRQGRIGVRPATPATVRRAGPFRDIWTVEGEAFLLSALSAQCPAMTLRRFQQPQADSQHRPHGQRK